MTSMKKMESSRSSLFVLSEASAKDVARALIEGGRQTEPFFMLDLDVAHEYFRNFREKLPRVQIFYAMKANDDMMMMKLLIALGSGFDCASPGEINKIKMLNVCPTSIIFAMPMKNPDEMIFARQSGVRHTTFDSSCELKKLKYHWPDARLLIRIKLESESVYNLGEKFGCEFDEAVDLLEEAAGMGLKVIGVAFHVGSGCFTKQSYMTGLRLSRELFDYEKGKGRGMKILDIGGGFFDDHTDQFDEVADLIKTGLEEFFPEPDLQIVAEPGRYLCESAFTLYTKVNNIRTVTSGYKTVQNIYINNGIHDNLRFIEKWHTRNIFKRNNVATMNERWQDTMIWGPTADDRDHLEPCQLPPCLPQDWLEFHYQGAYCKNFKSHLSEDISTRYIISSQLWDQIKDNPIFSLEEVVIDPDISTPLPSNLPPLLEIMNQNSDTLLLEESV